MNIKEEVDTFSTQEELIGKIIDYQFLVKPKQEPIDIKPNFDSRLEGEIITNVIVKETNENNGYKDIKPLNNNRKKSKFQCDECLCFFKSNWSVKRHKKAMHSKKQILYKCDKCDFQSNYKYNMKQHIESSQHEKITVTENSVIYNCSHCDYKSANKFSVRKHGKNVHGIKQEMFVCTKCGYETNRPGTLQRHSFIHNNVIYSCDLCPFQALSPYNVKRHKDYFHLRIIKQQRRNLCELCGKSFIGEGTIKRHLVTAHQKNIEIKTYICYTCGYKNYKKEVFITHVQKHMKSTKMFCANCDYNTHFKTNLIQHMVKHTDNVKMHKCHVCKFETKRPHTLRHHIKTHS